MTAPAYRINALARLLLLVMLTTWLAGCSPRMLLLQGVADGLAASAETEDDLQLAREAAAYHLKLSESVLRQTPDHQALAEAVAAGFTQYAYAFVAQEADELAERDARAAQLQRARAAQLYWRAQQHAMRALELRRPGFAAALAAAAMAPAGSPSPLLTLDQDQLGLAYWGAAAWGAHISLSKHKPGRVADLPQALLLARLAWQIRPDYAEGGLSSLRASFEAARPGGSRAAAEALFERAAQAGAGRSAGVFVARAEALALLDGDRTAFEALLAQALVAADLRPDLANQVMRRRAQWLLDRADDLF